MAKTLKLGRGLTLPLDAITETIGIVGQRGSGKTHTAGVFTEQALHADQQVVIVDPLDVWWGLRASADGKKAGLPITVLGGTHGDVPIGENDGATIAELIATAGVSVIICLEHLSKAAQRRFMAAFAKKLYRTNKDAMHLVIDEADIFAPQKMPKGAEACKGAVDDLVRRGRAKGVGVTLITQRPAVIDKDVLSQVSILIAHRLTGPQDQKAIWEWVRWNADETKGTKLMQGLAKLKTGRCWVYSPSWLELYGEFGVSKKTTFDSSATPKAGQRRKKPKKMAKVDLAALKEKLATTIEAAADKNPAKLRARVKELERELAKKPKAAAKLLPTPPGLTSKELKQIESLKKTAVAAGEMFDQLRKALADGVVIVEKSSIDFIAEIKKFKHLTSKPHSRTIVKSQTPKRKAAVPTIDPTEFHTLRKGAVKMLRALASVGQTLSRSQIAMLSGLKAKGSTFSTYLSDLRRNGMIDDVGSNVSITDRGLEIAGNPAAPSRDEIVSIFRSSLRAGAQRMLDLVLGSNVEVWQRVDLAEHCELGASGSTFSTYLSDIKRTGLVLVTKEGVRANPDLDELAA